MSPFVPQPEIRDTTVSCGTISFSSHLIKTSWYGFKSPRSQGWVYAAKVVFDSDLGKRSLIAYRNARQHSMRHPCLASIAEFESEWTENSFVALMHWVDGTPLNQWIGLLELYAEELGETLLELTGRWIESMCAGLAALHDAGPVHGDVSLGNLIESRGEVTLVDYDLLLKHGEKVWSIGTPIYAPPDKIAEQPAKFSDDVSSFRRSRRLVSCHRSETVF